MSAAMRAIAMSAATTPTMIFELSSESSEDSVKKHNKLEGLIHKLKHQQST